MTNPHSTVVHRWFQEIWNDGHEHVIDELMDENAVVHGITDPANDRGPQGFKHFYNQFRADFSNVRVVTDHIICEDDFEVAHCHVTATHTESGKPVSFSGVSMARIAGGKIAEAWNYFDFLGMYQQLGLELAPKVN